VQGLPGGICDAPLSVGIVTDDGRFEITEEDGKQTLIIKDLKLDDAADFTCKIGDRETSAKLTIDEGKQ